MKTVSREELYEQVWSKPMTKVAADYGVTGTALKKTCDRHLIPTPERGYWAKVEYGKRVSKEALPSLTEPNLAIHANPYSGLRRTYSDGKTQALERMLPDILAGFVGHAAYISERRRESDERERRHRETEARRQREEAFNSREKRRMEFVDAVHEQLTQRDKLTAVLRHLEEATSEDAASVSTMTTWIRQRLKQIDALISPHFLDISARSSKVDFAEPDPEEQAEWASFYYSTPINLQLWSVDNAEGLATSCSPLEWTNALALPIEGAETGSLSAG